MHYDVAIIGGGILGLSTGMVLLQQRPDLKLILLEKESSWASHQTGRNSGVIHSGIYYKPGSLKARFAKAGNRSIVTFCQRHNLPVEICGKVIVATRKDELPRLDALYKRGLENGLEVENLNEEKLREIEPHVAGIGALYVPSTGIVDYSLISRTIASEIVRLGGELRLNTTVTRLNQMTQGAGQLVSTSQGEVETNLVVNCAGLYSDRVAHMGQTEVNSRIIPFRGEYYELTPSARHLVHGLIYPIPDPAFPFLGVHFTKMIDGNVHAGPNAVLSLKREGYKKTDVNLRDATEILAFPVFWRLASRHVKHGLAEVIRSWSRAAFLHSLQRLIPNIRNNDIKPSPAGVRAQALKNTGELVDDFLIVEEFSGIHIINAPSPAATSSLEIAKHLVHRIASRFPIKKIFTQGN